MIKYSVTLVLLLTGMISVSQPGWNWPEGPDENKLAKEKEAYYRVQMELESFDDALKTLNYLYEKVPDLNESIYIQGAKIIDEILDSNPDESRITRLEDSLLWTFDMRIRYFDNDAAATDRKAYTAFKRFYKTPSRYPLLRQLYQNLYELSYAEISDFNLTPYMTLANYYHKTKPEEFGVEDVLDTHQTITAVIEAKLNNGGDYKKLQKEQDKIDAFLSTIGDGFSCEFIEKNILPRFKEDPGNLGMAKKIFSYSLKAKCTDKPYFTEAGETLFVSEPSYKLAKALADRAYVSGQYQKAINYYEKAYDLARSKDERFETLIGKGSVLAKLGNKPKAREVAYQALQIKPGASEAYNLIGNLYYTSYEECKGGESRVKDLAIFYAAYNMYQKAGNTKQMAATQEHFPGVETYFSEGYEAGQEITVGCWINETVVIQKK